MQIIVQMPGCETSYCHTFGVVDKNPGIFGFFACTTTNTFPYVCHNFTHEYWFRDLQIPALSHRGVIIPRPNEIGGGYTGFILFVRLSVRPSVDDRRTDG